MSADSNTETTSRRAAQRSADRAATIAARRAQKDHQRADRLQREEREGQALQRPLEADAHGGEEAEKHLRGDDVLFKCQTCGTLYMGPPLGHVRDPQKQSRFVEKELTAILQAAGGTLPAIKKNDAGRIRAGGRPRPPRARACGQARRARRAKPARLPPGTRRATRSPAAARLPARIHPRRQTRTVPPPKRRPPPAWLQPRR